MKHDAMVIGAVILALAGAALLVIWLNKEEPVERALLEGLAGPQPAPAPAAIPAAASTPAAPAARRPGRVSASLLFAFDRATLRPAESAKLDRLLKAGFKRIEAVGHADRIGPAAYNMELSARRAAAVKAYLVGRNVDPEAVRTRAKGELESATGDACVDMGPERRRNAGLVECLQPDRRVELTVVSGA